MFPLKAVQVPDISAFFIKLSLERWLLLKRVSLNKPRTAGLCGRNGGL